MSPRWLALYLLGIAALTLFPFASPECESHGWVARWGLVDFGANTLAFIPIGLALHRSSRGRALLLAFALSLTIELCQHWLPRQQDVSDLVSNTLGAGIGHMLGRAWTARWSGPLVRPVTRQAALVLGTPILLITVGIGVASSRANDLSNWHPFPLVIGNTAYGDRPWMGEVSDLAIFDRKMEGGERATSPANTGEPALWAEGGPILWLRFRGREPIGRIDGPDGPVRYALEVVEDDPTPAEGLRLVPSGLTLAPWVSGHVVERLREAGQVTVDVQLESRVLHQHGPARIVSLGDGGRFRNLMLGQQSSSFAARIRTPANGRGGTNSEIRTPNGVVTGKPQRVRLTYDGSHAVIWVDGKCEDSTHMALSNAGPMLGPLLGVTIVLCTAWPALAAASFVRGARRRFAMAAAGAAGSWAVLSSLGAWSHLSAFSPIAFLLGTLSFVALLPMLRTPR